MDLAAQEEELTGLYPGPPNSIKTRFKTQYYKLNATRPKEAIYVLSTSLGSDGGIVSIVATNVSTMEQTPMKNS